METKGVAAAVIAVVIIVAIIAAVGVWYVTTGPAEVAFSREQSFQVAGFYIGPEATYNPISPDMGIGYQTPDVYEALAYPNPVAGGLSPWLAESWSWVDDHTLRINIRPEAHFRKGQPVTAEDVEFSLFYENEFGVITSFYQMLESVEVVDTKTLLLHVKEEVIPRSRRVEQIMIPPTRIVNKEQWSALLEEYGENILQYANMDPDEMNGSGPYTLEDATAEISVFKRVDDYWGNEIGWYFAPRFYSYVYCGSYDAAVLLGVEEGKGDVIHDLGGRDLAYLTEHKDDLSLWNPAGPTSEWQQYEPNDFGVAMNIMKPIFREKWMREVVAYALDYHRMGEVIYVCEVGVVTSQALLSIPEVNVGFPKYIQIAEEITAQYYEIENDRPDGGFVHIKYDPEKAVEILSEHCEGSVEEGWTWDGEDIGPWIAMGWLEVTPITNYAEVIAACMEDIGIECEVTTPPTPEWVANYNSWQNYDLVWSMTLAGSPNPIAVAMDDAFAAALGPWAGSACDYQTMFSGDYPPLEDTADEVAELVESLWNTADGTQASYDIMRQIYEIVIPQLPTISVYQNMSPVMSTTFNWTNWTHKDDPLDYGTYNIFGSWFNAARHVYPKWVETVSATLSDNTVEAGEPVTVEVTLKNNGDNTYLYPVYVHEGPAEPGLHDEDIIAYGAIEVPAGETATIELEVTIDTPGTYTLTVDDWRYSEWDPGEPIELTLTVE